MEQQHATDQTFATFYKENEHAYIKYDKNGNMENKQWLKKWCKQWYKP